MRKTLIGFLSIFITISVVNCSRVEAGYIGIKVDLLGGNRGVQAETLPVGRHWIGMNEELYLYPTFTHIYSFTKDSNEDSPSDEAVRVQTAGGVTGNFDFSIQCHADEKKATVLFQKYRKDFSEIIKINLRNSFRDKINEKVRDMSVEEAYSTKINKAVKEVEREMREEHAKEGIVIESVSLLGRVRFDPAIEESMNQKIIAVQNALKRRNEIEEAEASKKIKITEAEGEARANAIRQGSLTPMLIQYSAIEKWDGKLPQVTGNQVPFIQLNK